jgi:hypothetical protein
MRPRRCTDVLFLEVYLNADTAWRCGIGGEIVNEQLEGGGSGRAEIGYLVSGAMAVRASRLMPAHGVSSSSCGPCSRLSHHLSKDAPQGRLWYADESRNRSSSLYLSITPQFVNISRPRFCNLPPMIATRHSVSWSAPVCRSQAVPALTRRKGGTGQLISRLTNDEMVAM